MLIVLAGLPGTGKSALARELAARLPAVILDKDRIRAALFGPDVIEYSTEQDDFCMEVMLQAAAYLFDRDRERHVILDGRTFGRRYQVERVRAFARERGVAIRLIECVCADDVVRERLARDVAEGRHVARNRTYDLYLKVKAQFEPIKGEKLVLDTGRDLALCVAEALVYLDH
ncbi:MAG: ATP-binding protein [Anaerolineae bacterium]|nr:ATP-binding protein [Anaerolineae bacterium]